MTEMMKTVMRYVTACIFAYILMNCVLVDSFALKALKNADKLSAFKLIRSSSRLYESTRCLDYGKKMSENRWGGRIVGPSIRMLNNLVLGIIFTFIMRVLNRFKSYRRDVLINLVFNRKKCRPLLTLSNHQSVVDDPGIWAAMLPWWRMHPEQLRWALCTEDVYFAKSVFPPIFGAGNVMPLDRGGSIEQSLLKIFRSKLLLGKWCHIFPEGRVWQSWRWNDNDDKLGDFKIGVGKLIAHCDVENIPIVLPMYYKGMDQIIPEVVLECKSPKFRSRPASIIPKTRKDISVHVGEPIDFTAKVKAFRAQYPTILDSWKCTIESIQLYTEITREIRDKMVLLSREANMCTANSGVCQ